MPLTFFIVPVCSASGPEAELNQFLNQNKIVNVEKHFVADGDNSNQPMQQYMPFSRVQAVWHGAKNNYW